MKWKFWRREGEIYVAGIEIRNKGTGSDDRDGGKLCDASLEWLHKRTISDFEGRTLVRKSKIA